MNDYWLLLEGAHIEARQWEGGIMHVLVTRVPNGRRYDVKVQVFHSLTLAVREMYEAHKNKRLVQFCIDHPFDDVLTLTTFDEFAQVFDREGETRNGKV